MDKKLLALRDALMEKIKKLTAENENLKILLSIVIGSLPSDEQIETESKSYNFYDIAFDDDEDKKIREAFKAGAKWMRNKRQSNYEV